MMSDVESSENESSDIDEYVSMAYKKFTEDNFATCAENSGRSLGTSVDKDGNSPKSSEATDMIRFVKSQCF